MSNARNTIFLHCDQHFTDIYVVQKPCMLHILHFYVENQSKVSDVVSAKSVYVEMQCSCSFFYNHIVEKHWCKNHL